MDSARWEQIQSVFHEVVTRPDSDRLSILESACGADGLLRAEVLAMLKADSNKTSLFDRGLPEMAYQMIGTPFDPIRSRQFGPYRLVKILGEGGMGVVWLAERMDAGNPVAIKFLPHAELSPARRERFAREIRTLARLKHPFIARLYDAGALADGTPWFVMEFVEGVGFTEYCRQRMRSVEDRLRLFRSICGAVQYAHGQEIIHRDLKPSNILVEPDGTPKLLDFGIARQLQHLDETAEETRPGLRFMSPDYAAPEWARDGVVGTYTDVYSLGVILYEMLTGRLPFDKSKHLPEEAERSMAGRNPEKPSVAARGLDSKVSGAAWNELDVLCLKAMHQDAAKRYRSVEALIRDIDHYLNGQPLEARPDTWRYRMSKFGRRNRGAVLAASLALALVACMIVFFTLRLTKERNTALAEAARTQRIQSFMLSLFQGDDKEAGPAGDLRVVTMIDRGVAEARSLSGEPLVQAELYQTLGTMYRKLGKLDRADALLQSSLKVRKSLADPDYAALAGNLIAIALLRSDQGQSKEAERTVREALAVVETHESRNESLLATANSALGEVLVGSGKNAEAIEILDKVVSFEQAQGPASPELAETLGSLADAHLYLGHYSVSDSLSRRELAIDRHVFGDNHPRVADDLAHLAQIQEMWGHYPEAERYERQALAINEAWYGKDHPESARKMTTLASTLMYEGKYSEADALLQQALVTQKRVYGNMHPRVAYVLNVLGSVAVKGRDFNAAEEDFRRMGEIYRSAYGDADYRVAVAMENLAGTYFEEGKFTAAEQMFRDVVQRFTKALSADNINTGITEVKLGRTLLSERRYREAEEQTRTGYEVLQKQTSSSTSFVQAARHDLAAIYQALGRPEDARKFRETPAQPPGPLQ
jgi:serine/threonine protein kinase/tetratricopeptide (TPR) repeat protein